MKKLFVEPYLEIVNIHSFSYILTSSTTSTGEDGMDVGDLENGATEPGENF